MLRAFHLRRDIKFDYSQDIVNVMGLPLNCILIEGQWFFNVTEYLELFYQSGVKTNNAASSRYYLWRKRFDDRSSPVYGKVVATHHNYYGDLDYLGVVTRSLNLIVDNGSLFTPTQEVKLEYEDGLVAIYRGTAKAPAPIEDSSAGFKWSDFYEVHHKTLVCKANKKSGDTVNVPVTAAPAPKAHEQEQDTGLVKPETPDDMPEVIKLNHPINKTDVRNETVFTPKDRDKAVTTLSDVGTIISQLAGGKKIKLTLTIELE